MKLIDRCISRACENANVRRNDMPYDDVTQDACFWAAWETWRHIHQMPRDTAPTVEFKKFLEGGT